MENQNTPKMYPLEDALDAQRALRKLAGLPAELFPLEAFVGMISDEIEALRKKGHTDGEIAREISAHSNIEITAEEIAANYASPEQRNAHHP